MLKISPKYNKKIDELPMALINSNPYKYPCKETLGKSVEQTSMSVLHLTLDQS